MMQMPTPDETPQHTPRKRNAEEIPSSSVDEEDESIDSDFALNRNGIRARMPAVSMSSRRGFFEPALHSVSPATVRHDASKVGCGWEERNSALLFENPCL